MANYKLTECEVCCAIIHKAAEQSHQDWHDRLDRRIRTAELVVGNHLVESEKS